MVAQSLISAQQESKEGVEKRSRDTLRTTPYSTDAMYALAREYFTRGDSSEAIRILKESLYGNPDFFRSYRYLARIYYELGRDRDAIATYREWYRRDPKNPEARHLAATASRGKIPMRCDDEYIASHFDNFAPSFDEVLKKLKYRGPEIIATALMSHAGPPSSQLTILDAGCGTGLCGHDIRSWCKKLVGVDISEQMVQQARKRRVYDEIIRGELCSFMNDRQGMFDVVVSADVLIYFGALEQPIRSVMNTLKPGGLFVGSVEALHGRRGTYVLGIHGRYSHHRAYIRRLLTKAGFKLLQLSPETIRWEMDKAVDGYGFVARKPTVR